MARIDAGRMPGGGGATRSSAGITGAGGRNVAPINRPQVSKGKAKVMRRVDDINETSDASTGGAFRYDYKKGKLSEVIEGGTAKVKPRGLGKVLKQMAPSNKEAWKKSKETNTGAGPFRTPKVPVKKSGK